MPRQKAMGTPKAMAPKKRVISIKYVIVFYLFKAQVKTRIQDTGCSGPCVGEIKASRIRQTTWITMRLPPKTMPK